MAHIKTLLTVTDENHPLSKALNSLCISDETQNVTDGPAPSFIIRMQAAGKQC